MTTEQLTELGDIEGFFSRGEVETEKHVGEGWTPKGDDGLDDEAPPRPTAAQIARRAQLTKLVSLLVGTLAIGSAALFGQRALGSARHPTPTLSNESVSGFAPTPPRAAVGAAERAPTQGVGAKGAQAPAPARAAADAPPGSSQLAENPVRSPQPLAQGLHSERIRPTASRSGEGLRSKRGRDAPSSPTVSSPAVAGVACGVARFAPLVND